MESELNNNWNTNRLGMFGIFRESFKTIKRNEKLLFPVLLLVFLLFSLSEFAQTYLLEPVAKDFSSRLDENPTLLQDFGNTLHQPGYTAAINDIRKVLLVNLFNFIFSSIISLVFLVATVSSSSEAYTAKVLDLKEMVTKIKKSWKKPILTSFYMIFFTIGAIFLCFLSSGIFSIFTEGSWAYLLNGLLFLSILVVWSHVSALWMLSLVVSVLENVGGLDAIFRARALMKGKKVQATMIMVLSTLAYVLFRWMTNALTSYNMDKWSRQTVSIPLGNALICTLKLFVFVVFTVFYHEMKASYDEKETKGLYVNIVAGEV